jgi:hypothetical protein
MKKSDSTAEIALPVIYKVESHFVPTVYRVNLKNRKIVVFLKAEGDNCEVTDYSTVGTKQRTGCRIHWEGTIREFITLFLPDSREIDLKNAFKNYVRAWYCRRNEYVA